MTATTNSSLSARDLAVLWHPCTQMKDHEALLPLLPIRRGEGVWLEDYDGRRYLDAISSWWVNLFGHGNPRISAAVAAQLGRLEHVIFAGFTHEPAVRLAEELLACAPPGLARCFYADNGSAGVEVALKMSFHYWRNRGESQRRLFVTLEGSYHGETLGALAVGNVALYRDTYGPLLMESITAPSPDAFAGAPGESRAACAEHAAASLRALLERRADEICAVIVEPLVQCAAGMRMYDASYLRRLRALCDEFGVHLIADEIAVGFGRTGTLFACEQAQITPDFLLLSKGLTGGFLPLAAVLTTAAVYDAFYDDYTRLTAFLHSHSYTGNPLACSAALATLAIFRDERVLERNRNLAALLGAAAGRLRGHPNIIDLRQTGLILAAEMGPDARRRDSWPWQERRGLHVYRHALERGVLLRPIGNVVYTMPPYVVTEEQIDLIVDVAREGIERAAAAP